MRTLIYILLILVAVPSAWGNKTEKERQMLLLEQGDSAYRAKNYTLAVEVYDSVARKYGTSPALYYNMANAWYEGGNIGMARLYLERAHKLDPSNKAISNNLNFVSMKIDDANTAELKGKKGNVKPDEPGFWDGVTESVCADRSSNYWAAFAAMAFLLLIASAALYLFTSNVGARKVGFFGGIIFLFFAVIFLIFSFGAASYYDSHDEGVTTAYKIELLTEPSPDSKPVTVPLNRGTKVRVVGVETGTGGKPDWYRVRLNRSNSGWLRASDLELI